MRNHNPKKIERTNDETDYQSQKIDSPDAGKSVL